MNPIFELIKFDIAENFFSSKISVQGFPYSLKLPCISEIAPHEKTFGLSCALE